MRPSSSEPLPSPQGYFSGELHITAVRVVPWPCGGRIVGFITIAGDTQRGAVVSILRQAFGYEALLRRYNAHNRQGEFALFATAEPPIVGEILRMNE